MHSISRSFYAFRNDESDEASDSGHSNLSTKNEFLEGMERRQRCLTQEQRALFPPSVTRSGKPKDCILKDCRAWERVDPDGLFVTVTVAPSVKDSQMGTLLHWDQHRSLTVMEAGRAQSFPDKEVILGNPAQKSKIIGNSVDRTVSLGLGLSLRDAWENNPPDDEVCKSTIALEEAFIKS
jgi:DNA (cytosine-5)-methyltransferase 1